MLGRRPPQTELFDVGNIYAYAPEPSSYYGQLAAVSDKLFVDEDFIALYHHHMGRPSTPPSLLALALIMQARENVSDDEAIRRTTCDLDWAVVLRRAVGEPLCAKSTLQLFRAQLMLNEHLTLFLKRSLEEARKHGLLKGQALAQAVDTKPIFGRGAVEDTYNLLAHAMTSLLRVMASRSGSRLTSLMAEHGFSALGGKSLKGALDIDWSDAKSREAVLGKLAGDARRLLGLADGGDAKVKQAAGLLEQILLQDVVESAEGEAPHARIRRGTVPGRVPSVTDPDQRHGRKSASKRFTGHKASVSAEVETGLILAVDVLAGDDGDATGLMELTEQAEDNADAVIIQTLGDCAYGSGATRQQFEDAGRELIAKAPPQVGAGEMFAKSAFKIVLPEPDRGLELTQVTCPAGHTAQSVAPGSGGGVVFRFGSQCADCPLRSQCTTSAQGRSVHIHPQERLIAAARQAQASVPGRALLRKRLIVENTLARLAALGIAQARYVGRSMTRYQLVMAATVANLRRVWNYAAAQPA